jgi:Ca-activated chloride channel homolog
VKSPRLNVSLTVVALALFTVATNAQQTAPQEPRPTFRSSVDLVSVAAVVRDHKGRFVHDLKRSDFTILEGGEPRPIVEFHAEQDAPVRVALLFDVSGSMSVGSKLEDARQAARLLLSVLRVRGSARTRDEAAVFSFDTRLQSLQGFTADQSAIEDALSRVEPYGETSLYDAIAQTARGVAAAAADRFLQRRAVIVITDGVDTSSQMTPAEVSAIASGIDIPVYVMAVITPIDEQTQPAGGLPVNADRPSDLRSLAEWTGGEMFVMSAPAHQSVAARRIVDELRHQYMLAFDASSAGAPRPLEVRMRDRRLIVRARSGYAAVSNPLGLNALLVRPDRPQGSQEE